MIVLLRNTLATALSLAAIWFFLSIGSAWWYIAPAMLCFYAAGQLHTQPCNLGYQIVGWTHWIGIRNLGPYPPEGDTRGVIYRSRLALGFIEIRRWAR